ncbi:hypothetical protein BDQ17DRAFT_1260810 [Cyathus striatus]|nr:hypothetical protein BDQ17DRAFT_1260810 [Cyathus striatus]
MEFCDDALTEDEIHLICGVYSSYSGKSYSDIFSGPIHSWWPLPGQWESHSNGINWGYWTPWDEHWYTKRLSAIARNPQPLKSTEWRNKLRSCSYAHNYVQMVEDASREYIEGHLETL